MTYAYLRVSTKAQKIERQKDNITKYCFDNGIKLDKTYEEKFTAKVISRPEFDNLLAVVKSGDTIIFDSVSRMSRNADDGTATYFKLYNDGVNLVFLNEHYIDTDNYRSAADNKLETVGNEIADIYIEATNKVIQLLAEKQIRLAFAQAEKELDDIHSRVADGMRSSGAAAKISESLTGKTYNVKKKDELKKKIRKFNKTFGGEYNDLATMEKLKMAKGTFYKYRDEIIAEIESGIA